MKSLHTLFVSWCLVAGLFSCGRTDSAKGLSIEPGTLTLAVGANASVKAMALYFGGPSEDITASLDWTTSDSTVATVLKSTTGQVQVFALAAGTARINATGSGLRASATVTVTGTQLTSIAVAPQGLTLAQTDARQLTAIGSFADGSTQDLTSVAAWASTNPGAVTVDSSGLVKAHTLAAPEATATVSATFGGVTGTTQITVTTRTLKAIAVTPSTATVAPGSTQIFTATGTFTDGTTLDLSSTAVWTSSSTTVATLAANVALGVSPGATTVSASAGGVTGEARLTVAAATLSAIAPSPQAPSLAFGTDVQLTATGTFSDGSTRDLTAAAVWSADASAVSVSSTGLVHGVAAGTVHVTASVMGVTGSTTVTVTGATLTTLELVPASVTLAIGTSTQLLALGHFSDNTVQDLSVTSTWTSSSPTVTAAPGGRVTAVSAGPATVQAAVLGKTATALVTVTTATLVGLSLEPGNPVVASGNSVAFIARGSYSDGSSADLTSKVTWSSSVPATATVSNAPGSQGLAKALSLGATNITAALGPVTGSTTLTVSAATLTAIAVSPVTATIAKGTRQTFIATGTYSDGTTRDVSAQVSWTSGNVAVATLSGAVAFGASAGTSVISATLGGSSGSATLTVTAATVVSVAVSPAMATVSPGGTLQLSAKATFSDATVQDVTALALWGVTTPSVVTVSPQGVAFAVGAGQTDVTASFGMHSGTAHLVVPVVTLTRIDVSPANAIVAVGSQQQLVAMGTYSDGSMQNLTQQVSWLSSAPAVATVSAAGRATAVSAGSALITATLGSVVGSAQLKVSTATVVSVEVTPSELTLGKGTQSQLAATAVMSDGTVIDVTTSVAWSSNHANVASVSNAPSAGLLLGVGAGTATITASLNGISGSVSVSVTAATVASIEVTPAVVSLPAGVSQQFTAVALYSDGTSQDVTTQCTWTSAQLAVATISTSTGSWGRALTIGTGSSNIRCALGTAVGNAQLTVRSATLTAIEISPDSASLARGTTLQLHATGVYSDHTLQDLTSSCTWSSDATSVATVTGSGAKGLVTALAVGTANVSCAVPGLSASTLVTVTSPTLLAIEVTPADPTVVVGVTVQLVATGIYSDDTTQDLTAQVVWTSARATVASVSNAANTHGRVRGIALGTSVITAQLGGQSGTALVTVSNPQLTLLDIEPFFPTLEIGATQQLTVTGYYDDNTTQDLTALATWTNDAPGVVRVSNATATKGRLTGLSLGTANVTATFGGQSASTQVTVSDGVLTSIAVQPSTPNAAKGTRVQFTATGIFSDGNVLDITALVVWSSSSPSVAAVANGASNAGQARALSVGTTDIQASLQGIGGSTTLTVGAASLVSIAVTPASLSLPVAATQQLTATGTYTDGTTQDLTAQVLWSSTQGTVARVSNAAGSQGLVKALALGTSTVKARLGMVSGTATVTVSNITLQFIDVEPFFGSIAPGTTALYTATGFYSDGSQADITSQVVWSSMTPGDAKVSSTGVVTAVAVGMATVNADLSGITGSTQVTVQAPVSIAVTPTNMSTRVGTVVLHSATAIFIDGSQQDVTEYAVWTSSAPAVATVSNVSGQRGTATALSPGMTSIKASLAGVGGSTTLNVTP